MPKVIVLDTLAQEGLDLLAAAKGIEFEVRTGLKGDALRSALAEFDGAICRSGVKITADALEGNHRLKAIVRAGVGTDNIDSKAATRLGIVVMNTPAGNTLSTAEHTIAMMLALSRNIAPAYQSLIEGKWDRNKYMGTQLADKTLGIVGLGRIGQAVGARAKALQMRVLGFDPFLSTERVAELGFEPSRTVAEMLPQVDYLTVHTPLTDETRNLVGTPQLDQLRSRRAADQLRPRRHLRRSGAGRRPQERQDRAAWRSTCSPPSRAPTARCSACRACWPRPTWAPAPRKPRPRSRSKAWACLIDYLTTGAIRHAVNMTPLDAKTLDELRGYLDVAYRLGLLLAQFETRLDQALHAALSRRSRGQEHEADHGQLRRRLAWPTRSRKKSTSSTPRCCCASAASSWSSSGAATWARFRSVVLAESRNRRRNPSRPPARCSATTCCGSCSSTISGSMPISTAC